MAKQIDTTGTYRRKSNGEVVTFSYQYPSFSSLEDATDYLKREGDSPLSFIQRMVKVDAGNTARERAKTANGDSTRVPMTEEQKAEAKVRRQADKSILDMIKAKGLSADDLASLLG